MILDIFTALSKMLNASPQLAIASSFIWGILSMVLSPCHLASIPLIVGFIDGQGSMTTRRASLLSALFALGILVTIGIVGLVTGLMGRLLGDVGPYGNLIVAIIVIGIGLYLLGIVPLPFLERGSDQAGIKKKGLSAALMLGLIFGIALGPCTFAYMAPMLGVAFTTASANFILSAVLVIAYAVGHCLVIVFAGTFSGAVQKYLDWSENSRATVIVKKVCGLLVVIAGAYLIVINMRSAAIF